MVDLGRPADREGLEAEPQMAQVTMIHSRLVEPVFVDDRDSCWQWVLLH